MACLNILVHVNDTEISISYNSWCAIGSFLGWIKILLLASNLLIIDYCGLAHMSEQT